MALSGKDRVTIWEQEPCPISGFGGREVSRELPRAAQSQSTWLRLPSRVVLEAVLPRGARTLYGLLGASLLPIAGTACNLTVVVGQRDNAARIRSHLAPRDARPGLPEEYLDAVFEGAFAALKDESTMLVPCDIRFDCMASSNVGSSRAIFRALARAIVLLLLTAPSDVELRRLLESTL